MEAISLNFRYLDHRCLSLYKHPGLSLQSMETNGLFHNTIHLLCLIHPFQTFQMKVSVSLRCLFLPLKIRVVQKLFSDIAVKLQRFHLVIQISQKIAEIQNVPGRGSPSQPNVFMCSVQDLPAHAEHYKPFGRNYCILLNLSLHLSLQVIHI